MIDIDAEESMNILSFRLSQDNWDSTDMKHQAFSVSPLGQETILEDTKGDGLKVLKLLEYIADIKETAHTIIANILLNHQKGKLEILSENKTILANLFHDVKEYFEIDADINVIEDIEGIQSLNLLLSFFDLDSIRNSSNRTLFKELTDFILSKFKDSSFVSGKNLTVSKIVEIQNKISED